MPEELLRTYWIAGLLKVQFARNAGNGPVTL